MVAVIAAARPLAAQEASLSCSYAGRQYKVGEFACIAACHVERRLARCDAATASWTYVSDTCPSASINPPWPSDWTETPVAAAMTPIPLTLNRSAIAPDMAPIIAARSRTALLSR
jgi:hypothetical protein